MIIWCAYCQQFLKEAPPFEDLTLSHGMCQACSTRGLMLSEADDARLKKLVALQHELYAAGKSGDLSTIQTLIQKCESLGIRPMDMIFGLLNPMLVRTGELWSQGKITVAEEHRFTHFCEQLLLALKSKVIRAPSKQDTRPEFILAAADGNYHSFGLSLIHLWLEAHGYQTELIVPSLPMDELLKYTLHVRPRFLGISMSLPDQVSSVKSFIHALTQLKDSPLQHLFIGGYAVKAGLVKSEDVSPAILITGPETLVPYLPPKPS